MGDNAYRGYRQTLEQWSSKVPPFRSPISPSRKGAARLGSGVIELVPPSPMQPCPSHKVRSL